MLLTLYQLTAAGKRMSWHCVNASTSGCPVAVNAAHVVPAGCSWEAHELAVLEFVRLWLFCCSHAVHAVPAGCSWEAHALAALECVRLWLFCCCHVLFMLYQLAAAGKRMRLQCLHAAASGCPVALILFMLYQLGAAGKRLRWQCLNASASAYPAVRVFQASAVWKHVLWTTCGVVGPCLTAPDRHSVLCSHHEPDRQHGCWTSPR